VTVARLPLVSLPAAKDRRTITRALVLLSGGMDSTACLHWALAHYAEVSAIGFDYGQPHRDAETSSAGKLAKRRGVQFEVLCLADALRGGIVSAVPTHEPATGGIHRAFVPGRNLVFLSLALGRAATYWPTSEFDLILGACLEDASGFPDCTDHFINAANVALTLAIGRLARAIAPFSRVSKVDLVGLVKAMGWDAVYDLQRSWSCYVGKGPCGECTPCVLRRDAFAAAGLDDLCGAPVMTGGDVHRDLRIKG
jgi:7-cyano-7-deazaguanine synthase